MEISFDDLNKYRKLDIQPFITPSNFDLVKFPNDIRRQAMDSYPKLKEGKIEISTSTKLEELSVVTKDIDTGKLNENITRGKKSYTLNELQNFAKRLGINHRQNKPELIKSIKKKLNVQ